VAKPLAQDMDGGILMAPLLASQKKMGETRNLLLPKKPFVEEKVMYFFEQNLTLPAQIGPEGPI
jgi:hypothetical protein